MVSSERGNMPNPGRELAAQERFWRRFLDGKPQGLALPLDRVRRPVQSFVKGVATVEVAGEWTEPVAPDTALDPISVVVAAVYVLIFRYTGQQDIVLGSVSSAGAGAAGANPVALRLEVTSDLCARSLGYRLSRMLCEVRRHRDYPFHKLVRDLHTKTDFSRAPVFQVMVVPRGIPWALSYEPLSEKALESIADQRAACDLVFEVSRHYEGLTLTCEYAKDLFAATTIRRMLGHLCALAAGVGRRLPGRLDELPLIGAVERRTLLLEWSGAARGHRSTSLVHQLFEARARARPAATALAGGDQRMSYRQVNRRANRLAQELRRLGAGRGVVVAVAVERSYDLVVALLGVFKAGAVYLPLDPEHPRERLRFTLNDAQVGLLLTRRRWLSDLPDTVAAVCLDDQGEEAGADWDADPAPEVGAKDMAYLVYTSGTTGQPKGVLVEHGGLCDLVEVLIERFGLGADSRMPLFASASFDASILEMMLALASGGVLIVGSRQEQLPGSDLCQLLHREAANIATLPPSLLSVLSPEDLPRLKTVISVGEDCPAEVVQRWAPGRRFYNGYGPTEATIAAAFGRCRPGRGRPTIGRPIESRTVYVLDGALEPVAIGLPGELYIGGRAVARGYLGRPGLTAGRFLPDPFSPQPGARLYRSGDRARFQANGRIVFLGRLDQQIQLRGFRIELGEIEASLRDLPEVAAAAVVVSQDAAENRQLVAYVVPREGGAPPPAELRRSLMTGLPAHMVPRSYVLLDALPQTVGGKLDRAALRARGAPKETAAGTYVPPRTPLEEKLAEVWRQLLNVDRVSADGDFFHLGGHSLLISRMFSRLRQEFGVEIPIARLFEAPRLADFAAVIARARLEQGDSRSRERILEVLENMPEEEARKLLAGGESPAFETEDLAVEGGASEHSESGLRFSHAPLRDGRG